MDAFSENLNELLINVYQSIGKMEEMMIRDSHSLNLTISEMHFLEAVGKNEVSTSNGKTVSELGEILGITLPSVTLAVNKLVKKGYLIKRKSSLDGRVVHILLTERGGKVDRIHHYFHKKMVEAVTHELTQEEKEAMLKGIEKLNDYFKSKLKLEE